MNLFNSNGTLENGCLESVLVFLIIVRSSFSLMVGIDIGLVRLDTAKELNMLTCISSVAVLRLRGIVYLAYLPRPRHLYLAFSDLFLFTSSYFNYSLTCFPDKFIDFGNFHSQFTCYLSYLI
jgi:hypothetical protein